MVVSSSDADVRVGQEPLQLQGLSEDRYFYTGLAYNHMQYRLYIVLCYNIHLSLRMVYTYTRHIACNVCHIYICILPYDI